MKILLITTDLYKSIGGGQTVYRKIIEATPDVQFFYFRDSEQEDAIRPVNALSIPLAKFCRLSISMPAPICSYNQQALMEANRFAASVAGQAFDIVDFPDFYIFGSFLSDAFLHHDVKIGRLVLAMHGNISNSQDFNWGNVGDKSLHLRMLEQAQFESADGLYSISPRYKREWQSRINREVISIDPAYFVKAEIRTAENLNDKPSLYCIGRTERRKGNDLFVELTRWLKRDTFDRVSHIGDCDYNFQGIASSFLLENIAKARGIKIESRSAMDREQLNQLYASRSILVLPVRYDTLNLVAMEALFSGCPVAISTAAGVCDYLDVQHPGLPYVKIDFNNFMQPLPIFRI
jgi:glycosyltransferase involved in cell wall biosynthesis